jgi:hypothetical protein
MDRYDNLRVAVGAMTAWCADGPNSSELTTHYLMDVLDEGGIEQISELTFGLISLCGLLLSLRADEQRQPELATLQAIAARYSHA